MKTEDPGRIWSVRWLFLGFVLTGVGTTLLGCILPALSKIWHMDDNRAGILFAAQFSGAAFGAAFVSHDYFGGAVRGYLLLIASDPGGNNGAENYIYDFVGNRKTRSSTILSLPGSMFFPMMPTTG